MIDLDELNKLAGNATKGPWHVEWETCDCEYPCSHKPYAIGLTHRSYDDMPDDDFIFIAAFNPLVATEIIERLRHAEKDASRYRWLMQNAKLGIGRNGKDWDLQVDFPAPDSISEVSAWIDSHA